MSGELVLVTGGSGFLGAHCILALLKADYRVRTTVRSAKRQADVLAMLKAGGADPGGSLSFAIADLMIDAGWPQAVAGCDYVLHVASPFPPGVPKHEDDLIVPAREGALHVLRAARDAGVKRVVLTSSFAAIGYGKMPPDGRPFTEESWTDPTGKVSAYVKSKTFAERAAWDFIAAEGGGLELAVVNPVGIFGPVLGADHSTSTEFVQRMMDGAMPGLPRVSFGVVDARDVADLHVRAMIDPAARGERFLAVSGDFMTVREIAQTLKTRLGGAASRVSTRRLPDWLVRIVGLFNPEAAQLVTELGKVKNATGAKAVRMLGWAPRSREDALAATGESLIRLGLLKSSK
ncbi:SDR family oxidoreductase [Mesorhizobium opportunistum]|uniref:NAD-dependent epimerase/dehydratase n=1 Tax=Mesorhizobium opportunistum (strain LMG 24607 / HAMBI 3007 / WSM2075) TaxID=536019 RepID=F7YH67_MESOW|nr:aldehyde reductase [Mesorhizobium opportunistum]AEH88089.1 NAD-dependent epimerase/dehydratase [Mesorhizobium opportunistum WSM2075]